MLALAAMAQNHRTWRDYGGAPDAAQYSSLAQINRSNVNRLQVAWSYATGDDRKYFFNPVVVDRSLWARLMSLEGYEGARRLWQAHPEWVNEVWVSDSAPRDVDTQADVDELRPRHSA